MHYDKKRKEFGLNSERACITGEKYKDKYLEYQAEYRAEYGVYPELDIINKPFWACFEEIYDMLCLFRKRGFYGAWFSSDVHGSFNKRLSAIYEQYKKEWSFIHNLSTYESQRIKQMNPSECIVNNLGYRKDENGNYYEGTWSNGKLIYGLIYFSSDRTFFVGEVKYSNTEEYIGAAINNDEEKNNKYHSVRIGAFYLRKGEVIFYKGDSFICNVQMKNDNLKSCYAEVAIYNDGYLEGTTIQKNYNDEITVWFGRYKDGVLKSSSDNFWSKLWRWYIGFTLGTMYYMVKFTYGLPFWLIYRSYKKRTWR